MNQLRGFKAAITALRAVADALDNWPDGLLPHPSLAAICVVVVISARVAADALDACPHLPTLLKALTRKELIIHVAR
ncbi:hypothetical protein [Nonomuraea sp. NPDC050310]|uniref:hypothetical protein n=1 Tax=Nonomuraea sp. NPDC050310 TaxID=3154935 RepID=UPI0033C713BA